MSIWKVMCVAVALALVAQCAPVDSAMATQIQLSDSTPEQFDDAYGFRTFLVSSSDFTEDEFITDIELEIEFSRVPDIFDNPVTPFYEDIRFLLVTPNAHLIPLIAFDSFETTEFPEPGFSGSIVFDSSATALVNADRQRPWPGNYLPISSFDPVIGTNPVGIWTLIVQDRITGTPLHYLGSALTLSTGNEVQLVVGDYNRNGVVDAADYTVWKDSFGETSRLEADGSGNGVVDAADYTIWKDNFGSSTTELLAQSIPEPVGMLWGGCFYTSCFIVARRTIR